MKPAVLIFVAGTFFSMAAFCQPATINVTVISPSVNQLVGDQLKVVVTVSSTFEVQSVKATVEGRDADLVFTQTAYFQSGQTHPGWTNQISLSGFSPGNKTLTILANDVFGNNATAQINFVYDRPPVLTVTAPLAESVARPQLQITAACSDDDPAGCSITVTVLGIGVAKGQNRLDQIVSLDAYDGKSVPLDFVATDSKGQQAKLTRLVYVESNLRLVELESVTGTIWDVQPGRILFLENADDRSVLKIRQRGSGQDTVVLNEPGLSPLYGYLTPKGAIWATTRNTALGGVIGEWRDGALIWAGTANSTYSLVAKGDYAIWCQSGGLLFRDLVTGVTNAVISFTAGNISNDLSANGDVAFWGNNYAVYRYRGGVTTLLASDVGLWNTYPVTDGINVVYRKHTPCCGAQTYALALYGATGEVILAPAREQEPAPHYDYEVNNGWVAFTKLGNNGQLQVWQRSPAGLETQVTFFGDSSRISALNPNGEVIFWHGGRQQLGRPGEPPIDIALTAGKCFWQDGQWVVTIGRSLFQLVTDHAQLSLSLPRRLANGQFAFPILAGDGQSVVVQASQDLMDWTGLATNRASGGLIEFVDREAPNFSQRFYRAFAP